MSVATTLTLHYRPSAGEGQAQAALAESWAFETLVAQHEKRVYNLIFRSVGNHEDAADLTQETFIKAFRAYPRFRGQSQPYTWLCHIALNTCRDWFRKRTRQAKYHAFSLDSRAESEEVAQYLLALSDDSDPVAEFERGQLAAEVHAALQALPEALRTVVILRDLQQLSYEEIVQATQLSLGTVKSRLHQGRLRLRRILLPKLSKEAAQ
ncbi:MAG TPA: sigma-70 family RNA polymerase sigma factor [Armatimonadota bacterium]